MKKIFFLLNLIYFIGCQSDQLDCNDNQIPNNLKECLSRKVNKENVECCFLEITNNGAFFDAACCQNDETLNLYINEYKKDMGEGLDFKVQCKEDTPNKALYLKIGFLLILGIIII